MLIPNRVNSIPFIDEINRIGIDHEIETKPFGIPWTCKEYQDKFGKLGSDDKFYWEDKLSRRTFDGLHFKKIVFNIFNYFY